MIKRRIHKFVRHRESELREIIMLVLFLLALVVIVTLFLMNQIKTVILVELLVLALSTFLALLVLEYRKRRQSILLGFVTSYLLSDDVHLIDDVLGALISGRWKMVRIDPSEKLFETLSHQSQKGSYEMKRRICAALPALYEIDIDRAMSIARTMRYDWDDVKWRADNRRRMIESLAHIIRSEPSFVQAQMQVIEGDEPYAIIAIVEIMDKWRAEKDEEEAEGIYTNLLEEVSKRNYAPSLLSALSDLWEFLDIANKNPLQSVKAFQDLMTKDNLFLQIALCRNVRKLCRDYPRCATKDKCIGSPSAVIEMLQEFTHKDVHKQIRRPVARGTSLSCLIRMLSNQKVKPKAEHILWALFNDHDSIIRISAFDRIEKVLEVDKVFGQSVLEHIRKSGRDPVLIQRAIVLEQP